MICPFPRVAHTGSSRLGWWVASERRFGMPGVWVMWDDGGFWGLRRGGYRPSWHYLASIKVVNQ